MSRRGAEPKPAWSSVAAVVRAEVERILRARIARAERVYGGYAPSATFRMRLADGRRAFFKGINRDANDYMRWALGREERVYREIGSLIRPWAPRFYGVLRRDDWHALVLEDLGPANVPPWTRAKARAATRSFAAFHRSTLGRLLPRWLPRKRLWARFAWMWKNVAEEEGALERAAGLAGPRRDEALVWLRAAFDTVRAAAERLVRLPAPYALLHVDLRSDNVRLQSDLLRMFDWPNACVGPAEFDVAAFVQTIAAEGGPEPEEVLAWYEDVLPLRPRALDASVAAVAGYFVRQAWRPPLPGLPRLREVQRKQLKWSLPWAARRLGLPEPGWLDSVPP